MNFKILSILLLIAFPLIAQDHPVRPALNSQEVESITVPLKMVNGMPLISGELNYQPGYYLLDTGAPEIIINANCTERKTQAVSQSGSVKICRLQVGQFQWPAGERFDFPAIAMDLGHLERVFGQRLLGIIGYRDLRTFQVLFDLGNQRMVLLPAGQESYGALYKLEQTLPFRLQDHLPVIEAELGKQKVDIGWDTGSESNLLDQHLLNLLEKAQYTNRADKELRGLNQDIHRVAVIDIHETRIGNVAWSDIPFLITEFCHFREESIIQIDGLFGNTLFQRIVFVIDYPGGKIHFLSPVQASGTSSR